MRLVNECSIATIVDDLEQTAGGDADMRTRRPLPCAFPKRRAALHAARLVFPGFQLGFHPNRADEWSFKCLGGGRKRSMNACAGSEANTLRMGSPPGNMSWNLRG